MSHSSQRYLVSTLTLTLTFLTLTLTPQRSSASPVVSPPPTYAFPTPTAPLPPSITCRQLSALWEGAPTPISNTTNLRWLLHLDNLPPYSIPPTIRTCLYTPTETPPAATTLTTNRISKAPYPQRQLVAIPLPSPSPHSGTGGGRSKKCKGKFELYEVTMKEDVAISYYVLFKFGLQCDFATDRLHGPPRDPVAVSVKVRSTRSNLRLIAKQAFDMLTRTGRWDTLYDRQNFVIKNIKGTKYLVAFKFKHKPFEPMYDGSFN